MKIKLLMVDLKSGKVTPAMPSIRAEHGWTVKEFKRFVGKVSEKTTKLYMYMYVDIHMYFYTIMCLS